MPLFLAQQCFDSCKDLQPYAWGRAYDEWIRSGWPDVYLGDWLAMYYGC